MNYYQPFNPYFGQPVQPQIQRMQQPMPQQIINQPVQPIQNIGLQGKSVDSIDVVKAMDIPLDGSISYFPLTNGTAIVTKQLQMDGTSKTIIYEPVKEENKEEIQIAKNNELTEQIKLITQDNDSLKHNISLIKEQIEDLSTGLEELLDEMRSAKGGKK